MKQVRSIMCCCGSGLGTSMLVRMNVEKVLKNIGLSGIDVTHTSVSDAVPGAADLFIVGKDLDNFTRNLHDVILLENIISVQELEGKLKEYFEI